MKTLLAVTMIVTVLSLCNLMNRNSNQPRNAQPTPEAMPTMAAATPSSTPNYESLLPPQVGNFTRSDVRPGLNTLSNEDRSVVPELHVGMYRAPNGTQLSCTFYRLLPNADANAFIERQIAWLTITSASQGITPSQDVVRFRVVRRVPTNGGEMIVMQNQPGHPQVEQVYWIGSGGVFMAASSGYTLPEEFANAYLRR
jgi:hypothetical protein